MPTYRGLSKSDPEPCWTFCIKHVSQHIDKTREGILLKPAVDIQGRGLVWIQDGIIKMQKLIKATNQKSKITRKNITRIIINMYVTITNNVNISYCIWVQKIH